MNRFRLSLREPILVMGGYGYRNVGDEAILAGLLRLLERARVTVVSRNPAETTALHEVPAVAVGDAIPALRGHRSVLIGGGGLFGHDMGLLGRLLPAYGLLAAAAGRSVVLEGIGLDEAMSPVRRRLFRWLASAAERVGVRDPASALVAADWGIDAAVGADLSSHMPPAPQAIGERLLRQAGMSGRRPVIGLCLTAVNPGLAPAVTQAVAEAADQLTEVEFCLIPMSQHPFVVGHNDLVFARRVRSAAPRVKLLEGFHHPAVILSVFGRLAAVVGMRYHSLLFAERVGVPLVPIPYAPKCETWLAEREMTGTPPLGAALAAAIARAVPLSSMAS